MHWQAPDNGIPRHNQLPQQQYPLKHNPDTPAECPDHPYPLKYNHAYQINSGETEIIDSAFTGMQ